MGRVYNALRSGYLCYLCGRNLTQKDAYRNITNADKIANKYGKNISEHTELKIVMLLVTIYRTVRIEVNRSPSRNGENKSVISLCDVPYCADEP